MEKWRLDNAFDETHFMFIYNGYFLEISEFYEDIVT
jgi:hypothetical protein